MQYNLVIIILIIILVLLFIYNLLYLITTFYNGSINETFKNNNYEETYSFHLLLATMGKNSIFNMLDSIKDQLNEKDYLTIVFDGPNLPNIDKVKEYIQKFKCTTNIIIEEKNLGFWGHAIRNKYKKLPGDFIFHIDDDDTIPKNTMNVLRKKCIDKNIIYIFKMNNNGDIIWKKKDIVLNEIGTPMGIIPISINSTSNFEYIYGGDYLFYKKLKENNNKIVFFEDIIYNVKS